jgi:acetyltransferase-like isoleucine patch superfamily enzyme
VREHGLVTDRLDDLHGDLSALHDRLRKQTLQRYGRMNPFAEDLFAWRERGDTWPGAGEGVTIYNSTTVVGDVTIGDHTWIGPFCQVDGTGSLRIGHHCSISAGCQLLSHDTAAWALSGGREEPRRETTAIGDCCFLGTLAVVTSGVNVGDRCLIAAGAVVTKDVGAGSIVGGVPARVIGHVDVNAAGTVSLRYDVQ